MAEYIEKEPLLRKAKGLQGSNFSSPIIVAAIATAPTIDIVHCRDCQYWQDNNGGYPHEECRWGKEETPDADDFCSLGERKENESSFNKHSAEMGRTYSEWQKDG